MDGIEDKGIGARAPCRRQSVRVVGLWGDGYTPPWRYSRRFPAPQSSFANYRDNTDSH